eukprot:Gregarina_sp_Poly_1__10783@NODE_829_length_6100_cov_40_875849_g600_i0_p5_GENE_NODE_829_length_6100_cov_40_875849_g600_i0NODE_829_length_6100_cov_40_875849_g600_i0_p5_ORF_typecomplete_len126_score13_58Ricin_B_lectin/PF00652_22/0_0018_NODE_829_length_6100_cov_40_875849_g600_i054295806
MLHNQKRNSCLDKMSGPNQSLGIYPCDWNGVFKLKNFNQFWLFEGTETHHLFSYDSREHGTPTGHDVFYFPKAKASDSESECVTSNFEINHKILHLMKTEQSWESRNITIEPCTQLDNQVWDWVW